MTDATVAVGGGMAAVAAALAAVAGAVLVRGTTAVPAALWTVAACLAAAAEFAWRAASATPDPALAASLRLGVAALSVCPIISLLGAKRPQHGVWQFIVASLGVVLALPAVTALLVRPGDPPDVHLAERLLVLALVLVAWLNHVGTRRAWAATLVAGGQLVYVRDVLPLPVAASRSVTVDAVAAAAVAVGAGIAVVQSLGRSAAVRPSARAAAAAAGGLRAEVEPALLAVRETFGAAWTLRIVERFNTVAATRGWPCRLAFSGVVRDEGDATIRTAAVRTLGAILRRFVTAGWLRRHGWRCGAETTADARG